MKSGHFRLLATCVASVAVAGCDSSGWLAGTYQFEGSSVITALADGDTCGLPGLPTDQYEATFIVGFPESGRTTVTEKVNDCTFRAQVVGAKIIATDVECAIAPNAVARTQWGLFHKFYSRFLIDAERGTWSGSSESRRALAGDPNHHSCHTAEGRLVTFTGS
jgi:hypothetical protein